jgi:hypothetical protein
MLGAHTDLELLSKEESERFIEFYMSQAEHYRLRILPDGMLAFILQNKNALLSNPDGSITWNVREIGVAPHSFIELITGEEKKKRVYIPLCLVNPNVKQNFEVLIKATVEPIDGRYNSKKAEFYILTQDERGFMIKASLANLAMHYAMLHLFPPDFASKYASQHCPFCKRG